MQDGNITLHAIETIQKMASGGFGADVASGKRPFFLVRPLRLVTPQFPRPAAPTRNLPMDLLPLSLRKKVQDACDHIELSSRDVLVLCF